LGEAQYAKLKTTLQEQLFCALAFGRDYAYFKAKKCRRKTPKPPRFTENFSPGEPVVSAKFGG
jgi:hypothetical protein